MVHYVIEKSEMTDYGIDLSITLSWLNEQSLNKIVNLLFYKILLTTQFKTKKKTKQW